MTADKHREENCYNCVYYHHDYWNCQGADKPCHEYSPDNDEKVGRKTSEKTAIFRQHTLSALQEY